jgi:ATPase subunit of ABC transporter with duplicated ATPase domains
MKYEICPIQPPSLEISRQQYEIYLANYNLYLASVATRKSEVKAVLKERDGKRALEKKVRKAVVLSPEAAEAKKLAKAQTRKAKRVRRKLRRGKRVLKNKLADLKLRNEISVLQKTVVVAEKKPLKANVTSSVPKVGRTRPKKEEFVGLNRAARRKHLQGLRGRGGVGQKESRPTQQARKGLQPNVGEVNNPWTPVGVTVATSSSGRGATKVAETRVPQQAAPVKEVEVPKEWKPAFPGQKRKPWE